MKLRLSLCVTILTMVLFVAVGVAGESNGSGNMILRPHATVAGVHLANGNYMVRWQSHSPEATVKFLQHDKVVGTAEGKVVDHGTMYLNNEVVYDVRPDGARTVREIRFQGSREVLVFTE